MKRWLFVLALLCLSTSASGHRFAPSALQIDQLSETRYAVRWKTPLQQVSEVPISPRVPKVCDYESVSSWLQEGSGQVRHAVMVCNAESLVGQNIGVDGLAANQSSALLTLNLTDGRSHQTVLTLEAPTFQVPPAPSAARVVPRYTVLGIEHIWGGIDHLLFVLGLFLLVRGGRRLLVTITAFTVGHSMTLALVTLGSVNYPVGLIEFLIAASIFYLACELARDGASSLLWRKPWWLAGGFGLLHGMGFAGALAETGLPEANIPLALLCFNLGIEVGQIVFIGVVMALTRLLAPWFQGHAELPRQLTVLVLGVASAQWCIERGLAVFA